MHVEELIVVVATQLVGATATDASRHARIARCTYMPAEKCDPVLSQVCVMEVWHVSVHAQDCRPDYTGWQA